MPRHLLALSAAALVSSSSALAGVAFTSVGRSVSVRSEATSSLMPADADMNAIVDGSTLPDGDVSDSSVSLSGANMGTAGAQVITSATSSMLLANLGASANAFAPDDGGDAYGDGYAEVNIYFTLSETTLINIMADVFAEAVGDGDPDGFLSFDSVGGGVGFIYTTSFDGPSMVNESFEVDAGEYHVRMFIGVGAGQGDLRADSQHLDAGTITALLKLTIPAPSGALAVATGLALALRRRR